ncbi:hypothetical protein ACTID9_14445 [Brevibacillus fluminis]|uniref:hypothetical protein n=1 Tax=Brevibacillus fluminis TaxID=511487 RepID=UPI003F8C218D
MNFWIAPTGTAVQKYRFVGDGIREKNGWSFNWEYKDKIYLDHIIVEAIGENNQKDRYFIKIEKDVTQ